MDNPVLVAYSSRMGATADIASAIGEQLTHRGYQVDVRGTASAPDARLYSGVIVGSALHLGQWDRDAVNYLKRQAADLSERPTWLFQIGPSGPASDGAHPAVPHAVHKLCFGIGIEDPMTFGGNLDPAAAEGSVSHWLSSGHDETGAFRDWHQISRWADAVADQLDASRSLITV
jgi:menaquinone-dependent protoporphyrinogen oxidase